MPSDVCFLSSCSQCITGDAERRREKERNKLENDAIASVYHSKFFNISFYNSFIFTQSALGGFLPLPSPPFSLSY